MNLYIALAPVVLWAALVVYEEHAPEYIWRWLWLPALSVALFAAKMLVLIGTLGNYSLTTYLDRRE